MRTFNCVLQHLLHPAWHVLSMCWSSTCVEMFFMCGTPSPTAKWNDNSTNTNISLLKNAVCSKTYHHSHFKRRPGEFINIRKRHGLLNKKIESGLELTCEAAGSWDWKSSSFFSWMSAASFYPHCSLSSLCSTKGECAMRLLFPLYINYRVFELAWASVETCHRVSSGKKPDSLWFILLKDLSLRGFPTLLTSV